MTEMWAWIFEKWFNFIGIMFTTTSLIEALYNPELNPLSWVGDYFAGMNGAGYSRVPFEAPQDIFYAIIPWSYQWLW